MSAGDAGEDALHRTATSVAMTTGRFRMNDKHLRILASIGLAVGGMLGLAGTFAPSASLRGLAWGIDGIALVMASALLTVTYLPKIK